MATEAGGGLPWALEKAHEYADRILAGVPASTVLEGLGPKFCESVMRLVETKSPQQDLSVLSELGTEEFTEFLQRAMQRPIWGWAPWEDIFAYGANVADGDRYDAHGIAKRALAEQIACLVGLLESGPDRGRAFHTAPYNVTPWAGAWLGTAGGAYRDGLFVLVSHRDSLLADAANPGRLDVMAVIVNEAAYSLISYLQARYPHTEWVRGDAQRAFFEWLATRPPA